MKRVTKRKVNYTRAFVICHGKSEHILAQSIKSNLRLPIQIYSKNNGSTSIQIEGLDHLLRQKDFSSIQNFQTYNNVILEISKTKIINFFCFIIMDTDDVHSDAILDSFKNKKMFENHWLYDYIIPIYNFPNLDEVCNNHGYAVNQKEKTKSYQKIFPGVNGDLEEFQSVLEHFEGAKDSNIQLMLEYFNSLL
ncbi:MAG: hypothetical protein AB7U79_09150 [Candidatus Izemoplasmatales bacterium]